MMKTKLETVCLTVAFVAVAAVAQAVTIPMVHVGDANNAADSAAHSGNPLGQGAVDHEYDIGKYEVTAGQYCEFLNHVASTDNYNLYNPAMFLDPMGCQIQQLGNSPGYTYTVAPLYANRPVNFVSWGDAARFCNWLYNGQLGPGSTETGSYSLNGATTTQLLQLVVREPNATWVIPTEDEWYKAAYYRASTASYYDYPTHYNATPSNVGGDNYTDPSNHANFFDNFFTMGSPYYRTIVGEFENSASPYGTFDQGGNVSEWNESIINPPTRGLRGGSFYDNWWYMLSSTRGDYGVTSLYEYSPIGFRVGNVPEPGSIVLLGVSAIGLLAYAWRRRQRAA
jgi:formylglycine-generating enzyme